MVLNCTFASKSENMNKKILIIEDQLSTRKLLSHYLGNYFDVIEKDCAEDAIEWLNNGNYTDAIVADIIMPHMNGVEFLTRLKQTPLSDSPVLMLTSVENSSEKLRCFQLGARDYLLKPFNPDELRIRLINMIKHQSLFHEKK